MGERQHSSLLIWFGFIQQWIWYSETCRGGSWSHTCAVGGFQLHQTLLNVSLFLWFCWFESVHPPLSWAPASSATALTCSQQLWFPNTKEWKENRVHNLFILHESMTKPVNKTLLFFSSWVQGIVVSIEPKALLILTCLFPQAYCFSYKVLLSVWSLGEVPVICILSWTRPSAVLICVLFPVAQQKAVGMFQD